jgi:dsDNA-binding SOS-regulon protein
MASIRKRGDTYQVRVIRKGFPAESRTFKTRQEAERWARSVEAAMEQRQYVSNRPAETTLLADLLKRYRETVTPQKRGARDEATGLWLNRGRPRVKREERIEIRKQVRSCLSQGAIDRTDPKYHDFHERTSGRVGKLTQLGHDQATLFREQLRAVLPLYNIKGVRKTRGLVAGLIKTPVPSRASPAYIQRFYQIMYRINILASRP